MSTPDPWAAHLPAPHKPIPFVPIALVLFALTGLFTSYFTVPAQSAGVVLRFGRHVHNVPPGLHLKLPFGIDEVIKVPTQRQLKLEFGMKRPADALTNPDQVGADPLKERSMVTGTSTRRWWNGWFSTASPNRRLISSRCAIPVSPCAIWPNR